MHTRYSFWLPTNFLGAFKLKSDKSGRLDRYSALVTLRPRGRTTTSPYYLRSDAPKASVSLHGVHVSRSIRTISRKRFARDRNQDSVSRINSYILYYIYIYIILILYVCVCVCINKSNYCEKLRNKLVA